MQKITDQSMSRTRSGIILPPSKEEIAYTLSQEVGIFFLNPSSENESELNNLVGYVKRAGKMEANRVLDEVSEQIFIPIELLKAYFLIGYMRGDAYLEAEYEILEHIMNEASKAISDEAFEVLRHRTDIQEWLKLGRPWAVLLEYKTLEDFMCNPLLTQELVETINQGLQALGGITRLFIHQRNYKPDKNDWMGLSRLG